MRSARIQHPFSRSICRRVWGLVVRVGPGVALALGMHGDTVAIVTGDRVNLRGRPTLSSEVVAQVLEGETVVVLDSLELRPSRRGEVVQWHKIRLPEDTPVWVHAGFIDRTTKTVTASRLNVRAGPGDRYSILGHLAKDESVREIRIVDDWMEIAPPSGTYAYMAASYAALQPAAVSATGPHTAKTAPAATPPSVAKSVAASPHRARETPAASMIQPTPQAPPSTPAPDVQVSSMTAAVPVAPQSPAREPELVERPPAAVALDTVPRPEGRSGPMPGKPMPASRAALPAAPSSARRTDPLWASRPASAVPAWGSHQIIQREGILLDAMHIQAPAKHKLRSLETGRDLNFVRPASVEVQLTLYRGQRVIITGEERSAPGWPNLPILEARTIQLAP
ncbi:MAG TPA: SH3 domain-containing protein [Verrucomicrobiota bacterium]|nr:SH3 domain-containing protein [Verrucomicrobiota bacterium]HPV09066.1 SH3 domain-containing protein [Verrucomicrobiota bacterium]HPW80080.1 SH3 domain-containing protein [Verrucomicrobiota bacterium]HQF57628.1 SH3 domain-containing protein [Verrucomicrobiota bacterium]